MYKIDQLEIIEIGVVGENEAKIIEIDVRPWLSKWPDARFGITATRPGEETSYPCQSVLENGILKWIVNSGDVAISGRGKMDVRAYQDTIVAKTPVIMTIIEPTMPGTEGEAPEAEQGWIDQAHGYQIASEKAAREAKDAAREAAQDANDAEQAASNAAQHAQAAETAKQQAVTAAQDAKQHAASAEKDAEFLSQRSAVWVGEETPPDGYDVWVNPNGGPGGGGTGVGGITVDQDGNATLIGKQFTVDDEGNAEI